MALGPGKYDDVLTLARQATEAEAAILIVIEGNRGSGFSCQITGAWQLKLPAMLRHMADEIEASLKP